MKGIILAGGSGSRLYPITKSISKQALPIYDKPMLYYPLSILLMAGIHEILIISTQRDIKVFEDMLGDGSKLGVHFFYKIQDKPNGLAEAFILGEEFIGVDSVALVLGDNIFYGSNLVELLQRSAALNEGAIIFGYPVKNPQEFGIVEFDSCMNAISIEEKPIQPKSNYAVPGLYFYDNNVVEIAKTIQPSDRGELEITSVNNVYLQRGNLKVERMGRGIAWLDTGTYDGLAEAGNFVATVQRRQGLYVSCIEEVAYRMGYINKKQLLDLAVTLDMTEYGKYLLKVVNEQE